MPDDYRLAPAIGDHVHGDFAGKRAFALPVSVLRSNANFAAVSGFHGVMERSERRRNDDVAGKRSGDERLERVKKATRLFPRLVHLPIAGNHRTTQTISSTILECGGSPPVSAPGAL